MIEDIEPLSFFKKADKNTIKGLESCISRILQTNDFPGAHPVSFLRKHIKVLSDKDYLVCEKTDGVRLMLILQKKENGCISYFLDRKNEFYEANIYTNNPKLCLLDGEMYFTQDKRKNNDKNNIIDGCNVIDGFYCGDYVLTYSIFDFVIYDGQFVNGNLYYRLELAQKYLTNITNFCVKKKIENGVYLKKDKETIIDVKLPEEYQAHNKIQNVKIVKNCNFSPLVHSDSQEMKELPTGNEKIDDIQLIKTNTFPYTKKHSNDKLDSTKFNETENKHIDLEHESNPNENMVQNSEAIKVDNINKLNLSLINEEEANTEKGYVLRDYLYLKSTVIVKRMYKSYGFCQVYHDIPKLGHKNDGMVFTPIHEPYMPGRCNFLYKWKPEKLNTCDFLMVSKKEYFYNLLCFSIKGKMMVFCTFYDLEGYELDLKKLESKSQIDIIEQIDMKTSYESQELTLKTKEDGKFDTINEFSQREKKKNDSNILNSDINLENVTKLIISTNNTEKTKTEIHTNLNNSNLTLQKIENFKRTMLDNDEQNLKRYKLLYNDKPAIQNTPLRYDQANPLVYVKQNGHRYDKLIGEFLFDSNAFSYDLNDLSKIKGAWTLHRIRTDKNTPNSFHTVKNVLLSVNDGVSYEELEMHWKTIHSNWKLREKNV